MKKSLKFLIIFATVAVILSCSVFTSAASSSDIHVFTRSEFADCVESSFEIVEPDGDSYAYTATRYDTVNSSGFSFYLGANPGVDTYPYYFVYTSVSIPLYVQPGEYVSIDLPFITGVSSPRSVTKCEIVNTIFDNVILSPVATSSSDLEYSDFEFNQLIQNTTEDVWEYLLIKFIFSVSGSAQYTSLLFGFEEDVTITVSMDKPKYSAPSDEAIKEQDKLTSQIEDATADGIDEAKGVFNSFDSITGSDGHIYKGLLAATTILNEWLGIEWLSPIVLFSLVLGAFAFVLGMSFIFSRFANNTREIYSSYKSQIEFKRDWW